MQKPSRKQGDLALGPRGAGVTLTQWLYDELRKAILDGRLKRGTLIPPTRRLASQYGVSRRIVVNVFDQLREEGYLQARTGDGTRVSASVPEDYLSKPAPATRTGGFERKKIEALELDPAFARPLRPFRAVEPALDEFPVETWGRLSAKAVRRATVADMVGGDILGVARLREAIRDALGATRGVSCSADQIVITSGTQQGLDLAARAVLRPGDRIWMEDPGYRKAVVLFENVAGARVVPVPVDAHGMDPDLGRAACPNPKAVYLTPAHQFPTGAVLHLDRRLDLLRWTRQHNIAIFEDDYDSEFRFSGRPVPAMKGLEGSGHVFLLGTFNKCLFPALRLGYLVVPDAWMEAVVRLRSLSDRFAATLPQLTLAAFLDEGHFARHLRRMRELYGARLAALRSDVARYLGGAVELPEIQAGLNTPALLRNGMTSKQALARMTAADLEAWDLDRFALARNDLRGLLLGFAPFPEREIRRGVQAMARALGI